MILLNLFRQGHYFLNGFPFFVILYCYTGLSYEQYLNTGKDMHEELLDEFRAIEITSGEEDLV
jgi:hypothetical protein